MRTTTTTAELDECVAPLDDEGRRALRRYWSQVVWEEWVPPAARREPSPVSAAAEGRRRREARRAMARVALLAGWRRWWRCARRPRLWRVRG